VIEPLPGAESRSWCRSEITPPWLIEEFDAMTAGQPMTAEQAAMPERRDQG
jgi:hypothetical protein